MNTIMGTMNSHFTAMLRKERFADQVIESIAQQHVDLLTQLPKEWRACAWLVESTRAGCSHKPRCRWVDLIIEAGGVCLLVKMFEIPYLRFDILQKRLADRIKEKETVMKEG